MSAIFRPRKHHKGKHALLLFTAALLLAGCVGATTPYIPTKEEDALFEAKADRMIYEFVCRGENVPFVVTAVFKNDVFLSQSAALEQSFIPVLSGLGNAAFLRVKPGELLELLKNPSLKQVTWFGSQGLLVRLDPSLELDMLDRFSKGTESNPLTILARYRSDPRASEENGVKAAGFKILSKSGPILIIQGPMSGIPKILDNDWLVSVEKSNPP